MICTAAGLIRVPAPWSPRITADAFSGAMVPVANIGMAVGELSRDSEAISECSPRQDDQRLRELRRYGLAIDQVDYPPDDQLASRSLVTRMCIRLTQEACARHQRLRGQNTAADIRHGSGRPTRWALEVLVANMASQRTAAEVPCSSV